MTAGPQRSRDAAYFDRIYARSDDPWQFRSSQYERRKYTATLAALPRPRFRRGLEVGCSIGELTWLLGARCDAMLGIDIAAAPLAAARLRCAGRPQISFHQMAVPTDWPAGRFDLIVLSEVLYFLSPDDVSATAARVRACCAPGASVVLVNWLGQVDDPSSGDGAAALFIAALRWNAGVQRRYDGFRLDVIDAP
jgi:trans-aconitate methyltransferase